MADKLILDRNAMKDRSTSHLRIYVGGLKDKTTIDELYEHFIQFGKIDGIIVTRNFGFVQFAEESSAQQAITKGNGTIFQGKNINVRTAQQSGDKRRDPDVVIVQPDMPPADGLTGGDEGGDDQYDSYGNYVGDHKYREDDYEDGSWNGGRGRGIKRGRGRGMRGRGTPGFRERSPISGRGSEWSDRVGYDRSQSQEYPRALPILERNDCEIIVISKTLTEYAEYIEDRLKRLGIVVDLLFPMEDVPIGKVLGNIASRGCLYAILIMPQNQEHRSLTLTILHGMPQEHRNMPLEDALQLLSRNFQEVQRGRPSGREAMHALLGQLADGRSITVLQYEKVIEYLQERKQHQYKIESGETPSQTPATPATKTEVYLQQRILSILNEKKATQPEPSPTPAPAKPEVDNKLMSDPTVRKALDSILQKFT